MLWKSEAQAVRRVWEWLSYLNPFARHSPSLVDNVTNGVDVILAQYARLRAIPGMMRGAQRVLEQFMAATAGGRAKMEGAERAEVRADIVSVSPNAGPAVDALFKSIDDLRGGLEDIGKEVAAQKVTVDRWRVALDAANRSLDQQELILDRLVTTAGALKDQLDAATSEMSQLQNIAIEGWYAMEEAIWANQHAQDQLRLEILKLEDAGQGIDDIEQKLASLQGSIETLRAESADLRMAGAGSDVLAGIDEQIAAMEAQTKFLQSRGSPINELQEQLDDLNRQGQILDLEKAVNFSPLQRQLDAVGKSFEELPFDELYRRMQGQQTVIDDLTTAWKGAEAAVAAQQAVVDQHTAARNELRAVFDVENDRLGALKDAYSAVEQQIRDMESALDGMATAARRARDDLSQAQELFGAGAGFDFDDVGGLADIGREGGLLDIEQFNRDLEAELQKTLSGIGANIDLFAPLREKWDQFKEWVSSNGLRLILSGLAAVLAGIVAAIIGWPVLLIAALVGGITAVFGPSVLGALTDAWQWVNRQIRSVLGTLFGWVPGVLTTVFGAAGTAIRTVWESVIRPVFSAIGAFIQGPVAGFLNILQAIFTTVFGVIATVVMALWDNVFRPVFETIGGFIYDYVLPVIQVIAAVVEIVAVLVGRSLMWLWENGFQLVFGLIGGAIDVLGGAFNWLNDEIIQPVFRWIAQAVRDWWAGVQIIFRAVVGFLHNTLGPVFTWLNREVVQPVFSAIGTAISWVWENVIQPAFSAINTFIHEVVGPAFQWLLDSVIRPVWDTITQVIQGALDLIGRGIRNGLNVFIDGFNGLVRAIQGAAKWLNIDVQINEMPRLHDGGLVGGTDAGVGNLASDEVVRVLQKGEYVLPVELVKDIGVGRLEALRKSGGAVMHDGGLVGSTAAPTTLLPQATGSNRELHFLGVLSFPNITDAGDAEAFIRNLEALV